MDLFIGGGSGAAPQKSGTALARRSCRSSALAPTSGSGSSSRSPSLLIPRLAFRRRFNKCFRSLALSGQWKSYWRPEPLPTVLATRCAAQPSLSPRSRSLLATRDCGRSVAIDGSQPSRHRSISGIALAPPARPSNSRVGGLAQRRRSLRGTGTHALAMCGTACGTDVSLNPQHNVLNGYFSS